MPQQHDPRLTSHESWFQDRNRKHRHRHHRHKKKLRSLVKFIMPTVASILALATGWVLLKVFVLDRRAKPKRPEPVAQATTNTTPSASSKELAILEAETYGHQNAFVESRVAQEASPRHPGASDSILDPSAVIRSYSNRVSADVRAAMRGTNASIAARSSARGPETNSTSDLLLDPNAVIQKLSQRAMEAPGQTEPGLTDTNMTGSAHRETSPPLPTTDILSKQASYSSRAPVSAPSARDKMLESQARFNAATQLYARGDLVGTELACKRILDEEPEMHAAGNLLGEVYSRQQKWDKALAVFESVVKAVPDNAEYQNNLALVLAHFGRDTEAAEHFATAANLDPLNFTVLMNCGWHCRKVQRYPEALKYIEQALVLNPNHGQAKSKRIQTLIDLGQLETAEKFIQAELAAQPAAVQPHMMMALLHSKRGDPSGAIEWLRKAEQFTTRDALLKILEKVHDFDAIKDTPQYRDYMASLKP